MDVIQSGPDQSQVIEDTLMLCPSDVGIILSYQCQAACKHCLYNCGPTRRDWMAESQLREVFEAVLSLPQPAQVHITGGEPFLRFDLLVEAVRLATELGIPRYVETNAGWCVSESLATRRLTTLREAGLQALLISCSPFHAESIPPARTRLAYEKAVEVLGLDRVILYLPEWLRRIEQFGAEQPTSLRAYVEALGLADAGRLLWQGYGLISGGRSGYELGYLADLRPADAFRGQDCRAEILYAQHSHMDLRGNFIPGFCGGLALGDWHDLSGLRVRFRNGQYPPLAGILVAGGPFALYEMVRHQTGYQPLAAEYVPQAAEYVPQAAGYAGKCHLCVDVRRALAAGYVPPEGVRGRSSRSTRPLICGASV